MDELGGGGYPATAKKHRSSMKSLEAGQGLMSALPELGSHLALAILANLPASIADLGLLRSCWVGLGSCPEVHVAPVGATAAGLGPDAFLPLELINHSFHLRQF